jgi:hypothetical protein
MTHGIDPASRVPIRRLRFYRAHGWSDHTHADEATAYAMKRGYFRFVLVFAAAVVGVACHRLSRH